MRKPTKREEANATHVDGLAQPASERPMAPKLDLQDKPASPRPSLEPCSRDEPSQSTTGMQSTALPRLKGRRQIHKQGELAQNKTSAFSLLQLPLSQKLAISKRRTKHAKSRTRVLEPQTSVAAAHQGNLEGVARNHGVGICDAGETTWTA